MLKRSPPSQLPDPAVRHSAAFAVPATVPAPARASHCQPAPPRPPSLTPPPPLCSGVPSVRVHAAATYRTVPRERQRQQLAGRPGSRDSRQCMPRRAASTSCIAQIASHPVARLPPSTYLPAQQQHRSKQKASLSRRARLRKALRVRECARVELASDETRRDERVSQSV